MINQPLALEIQHCGYQLYPRLRSEAFCRLEPAYELDEGLHPSSEEARAYLRSDGRRLFALHNVEIPRVLDEQHCVSQTAGFLHEAGPTRLT